MTHSMAALRKNGLPPKISVVTPVYNEETGLEAYVQAVTNKLLNHPDYEFHVLLVDDGSTDHGWEMICKISSMKPVFQGIRLSRNYGAHVALSAGIANANGDAVATLACDLQDPPEVILEFLDKWRNGAKIVWGHRRSRKDKLWRTWVSKIFVTLLKRFAMPRNSRFTTGSFLLMDRKVVECFKRFGESNRITFAIVAWTGFDQDVVSYDRAPRMDGKSKWNFAGMLRSMYDAFIGFSLLPIHVMTLLGLGLFLSSILLLVYLVVGWMIEHPAPGWTSQMATLSLFFGIQFLLMGIMGEYLYRIYAEAVRRPLFFISDATSGMENSESERG